MIARKTIMILSVPVVLLLVRSVVRADGQRDFRASANSFDECVAESGKILKMYPPKCVTKDGRVFVQSPKAAKGSCRDLCGDGQCQEMVCMAVGCPCAESPATCPKDCPA